MPLPKLKSAYHRTRNTLSRAVFLQSRNVHFIMDTFPFCCWKQMFAFFFPVLQLDRSVFTPVTNTSFPSVCKWQCDNIDKDVGGSLKVRYVDYTERCFRG